MDLAGISKPDCLLEWKFAQRETRIASPDSDGFCDAPDLLKKGHDEWKL
jgi:hypothetical protein